MEKEDNQKITAQNLRLRLMGVDFKALPQVDGNLKLVSFDTVETKNASKDGFVICFSREVHLDPNAIFTLLVSFEITGSFDQPSIDYYKNDPDGFARWARKYQDNLVMDCGAPRIASALISSLTVYDGLNPVVLPPVLRKRKEANDVEKSSK